MGNLLCKKNKGDSPASPVDRVIGRCAQMCPQNMGKKKHFWEKQIFETSPPTPLSQQPKLNGFGKDSKQSDWETATLSVPDSPGNGSDPPVAPPRKKRQSLSPKAAPKMNHENLEERKESVEVAVLESENTPVSGPEKVEGVSEAAEVIVVSNNDTKSIEPQEDTSSKPTTVEPIATPDEHKEIQSSSIEKTGKDEVDRIEKPPSDISECETQLTEPTHELLVKINKEKGNILFSMEKHCNTDKQEDTEYEGLIPVEEEIIVPVKRITKHICDDDDHLHKILHKGPALDPLAPKKPQRDFAKYKKALDGSKPAAENTNSSHDQKLNSPGDQPPAEPNIIEQAKPNPSISIDQEEPSKANDISAKSAPRNYLISETETIPADDMEQDTPPPIPPKFNRKSESSLPMPLSAEVVDKIERSKRKSESVPPNMSNSEKILRRCLSTQSYLTPDLVEKIAEQANSLSLSTVYLPEDFTGASNDGSGLVSPNFKLTERRSLSSQTSRSDRKSECEETNKTPVDEKDFQLEKCEDLNVSSMENIQKKDVQSSEKNSVGHTQSLNMNGETESHLRNSGNDNVQVKQDEIVTKEVLLASTNEKSLEKEHIINPENSTKSINTEPQNEKKLKKRISVNANIPPEEITNTIQAFLGKENLSPKIVLKLLEDEFGDVLHSKSLPQESKDILEELRKTATNDEPSTPASKTAGLSPKDPKNEKKNSKPQIKVSTPESNTKPAKIHHSKIPKLKNKTLDAVAFNEKRRHSIDEMESWFSPQPGKTESTSIKRRRESSLPNCLESPPVAEKMMNPSPMKVEVKASDPSSDTGSDHSSLLKFLENEKNNHIN